MILSVLGTIICVDCQKSEEYRHADDLEGWRLLGPAKAYFKIEGRCPKCQHLYELSDEDLRDI